MFAKNEMFDCFHRILRVRQRIKSFYDLLVKDSLNREDVEEMEEQKTKNFHEVKKYRGKEMCDN